MRRERDREREIVRVREWGEREIERAKVDLHIACTSTYTMGYSLVKMYKKYKKFYQNLSFWFVSKKKKIRIYC